jgi:membrane-associated phospholipid phosphatase
LSPRRWLAGARRLVRVCALALPIAVIAGTAATGARADDAATGAANADSAGVGWRTSAGIIRPPEPPASAAPHIQFHPGELRPRWRDVAFVASAATAVALLVPQDRELVDRATAGDSQAQRDLARIVQPFGFEVVVASGAVAWGGAWLAHRDALFAAAQRADLSIASAVLVTVAIKKVVGRKRPDESPDDAWAFDPFTGHDSFPSAHTTMAFAAAAALDRETSSRWVPAVGYPLAALVGWSRIHDRQHWTSDVVAGAAVGFGVTWKMEDAFRGHGGEAIGARLGLEAGPGRLAAVRVSW